MIVEHVRVGEVLSLKRREVTIDPMTEYRLVGVYSFGNGIFQREPKAGAELGAYRFFAVEPGDLVLSNIGAWEGGIAFARPADAGLIGNHRVLTYVPRDARISANWARWFFVSEGGMDLIRSAAPGTVMRNRTLAIDRFEALEIPLPPIDQQRSAADQLDRLEAATSQLRRRSDHASALLSALVVSMSSRPDLDEAAKAKAGWRHVALREFVEPSKALTPVEPSQLYEIAGIYSFGRGLIDRGAITGADTSYKTLTSLSEGDIVVSKLNGWEGAVAVVEPRFEGHFVSSEYPTYKADRDELLPAFFGGIARSPRFWESLNSNARGSMVRRRRINATEFLATQVWLPPMETQQHVAGCLQTIDRAGQIRVASNARAEAVVPAALNQAFAGIS